MTYNFELSSDSSQQTLSLVDNLAYTQDFQDIELKELPGSPDTTSFKLSHAGVDDAGFKIQAVGPLTFNAI